MTITTLTMKIAINGVTEEPFINDRLELRFEKEKPDDVDLEESKEITTLIRSILQYKPAIARLPKAT